MMRVFFTKHREQWYGPREIKVSEGERSCYEFAECVI